MNRTPFTHLLEARDVGLDGTREEALVLLGKSQIHKNSRENNCGGVFILAGSLGPSSRGIRGVNVHSVSDQSVISLSLFSLVFSAERIFTT